MTNSKIIENLTKNECLDLLDNCNSWDEIASYLLDSPSLSVKAKKTLIDKFEEYEIFYKKLRIRAKGPIWNSTRLEFIQFTKKYPKPSLLLASLNIESNGSNFITLKKRFELEGLDYETYKKNKDKVSESDLKEGSVVSSISLKEYVLEHDLIEYKCSLCGQEPFWMGNPLSLKIFHKNGSSKDNRIENLGFICPNCQLVEGVKS